MQYEISERMAAMQPSMIREILKATSNPEVIAFSAGNPAPNAFPIGDIAQITADILQEQPVDALQYGVTEGYPLLLEAVRNLCKTRYDISISENEGLMIISGAQQGADLVTKTLINPGDTVLCEDPSFIGCLNCFRSYRAKLVGIEMEEDGVNLEKLEAEMKKPHVKLFYMIPNFQNPSGITTSLEKRNAVLALAQKYNVMILEDNPYGDLRFHGETIPSIKSMDTEGAVIYMGSFSKIIAPGLRVGYVIAPKEILAKMVVGKQCADVHTTMLSQMICYRFLATRDLDSHLSRLQGIYRGKCELMISTMEKEFASGVAHTNPEGGLFLWCTLPEGADMTSFCQKAVERGVAVVPGIAFLADPETPCRSFRMNFSTPADEAIVEGVKRLGLLTKEFLR